MHLISFLKECGVDPDRLLCVAVGSDRPSANSNMFAMATMGLEGTRPEVLWVEGADFAKVSEFVGVPVEEYEAKALPLEDFVAKAASVLADRLLVTYTAHRYTAPLLLKTMAHLAPMPDTMLDVVDLHKAMQRLEYTPETIERTWGMLCRQAHLNGDYSLKGCTLTGIHQNLGFEPPDVPYLEKRAIEVRDVLCGLTLC
jgi:hypothetical protein